VSGAPLLVAESLTAGYGRIDILHDVSLTVAVNEIVSIIGPSPRCSRPSSASSRHAPAG
jgi:ABC-type branched-subunit amino acid transport system ATPase component